LRLAIGCDRVRHTEHCREKLNDHATVEKPDEISARAASSASSPGPGLAETQSPPTRLLRSIRQGDAGRTGISASSGSHTREGKIHQSFPHSLCFGHSCLLKLGWKLDYREQTRFGQKLVRVSDGVHIPRPCHSYNGLQSVRLCGAGGALFQFQLFRGVFSCSRSKEKVHFTAKGVSRT